MSAWIARTIVRLSARLAPRDLRERWREEWLGEIHANVGSSKWEVGSSAKLLRRALGAPWDALSSRWLTRPRRRRFGHVLPGWIDLKLAVRAARATPLVSLTAVFALSVGIGLATAAFTVVKAALYGQLLTSAGERILALKDFDRLGRWDLPVTLDEHERRRRVLTSFSEIAAHTQRAATVSVAGFEEVRHVAFVSFDVFKLLGVAPVAGREFVKSDALETAPPVALISEWLARRQLGSVELAPGQVIHVDGQAYAVVGVIPAPCRFPFDADLWLPLKGPSTDTTSPAHAVRVVARLRPGVEVAKAEAELIAVASQVPPIRGETRAQRVAPFGTLADGPEAEYIGWAVIGAFVLLLLVSAANVANLLLARAAARQRELALRAALGASRGRIISGIVLEAAVLGASAAGLGLLGANVALAGFRHVVDELPYWVTLRADASVVLFVAVLASVASLFASIGPALRVTRGSLTDALGRSASGIRFGRLSATLIIGETAVAIGLLAGAALIARGLFGFGYQAYRLPEDQLVIAQLYFGQPPDLDRSGTANADARRAAWQKFLIEVGDEKRRLSDRLEAIPSVRVATYGWQFPGSERFEATIEIARPGGASEIVVTRVAEAGENFFAALNASVIAGRDFTRVETDNGAAVAIVNEPFARKHFRGHSPLGQRIKVDRIDRRDEWREIVGVVPDLAMNPGDPERVDGVYAPAAPSNVVRLAVLVDGNALKFVPAIREAARGLKLHPQVQWTKTLGEQLAKPAALFRGLGAGLIAMGAVALLLACTGIHAIVAFSLAQRRRELAVRIALGAGTATITRALLDRTIRQLALGALAGALFGTIISRLIGIIPFDVPRSDPWMLLALAGALVIAGTLACAGPLRRALTLRPNDWLRDP